MINKRRLDLPVRFRRRLTFAFVATVGVASFLLAIGSYTVVSHQRHDIFENRSIAQTKFLLSLARGEDSAARLDSLFGATRQRNGFETLIVADTTVTSDPSISEEHIPADFHRHDDQIGSARVTVNNVPYLVITGDIPESESPARLYLWFSEASLNQSLEEVRNVLIGSWLVVTLLSSVVGRVVAVRTLAPIQQAADAARFRAEGLLHMQLEQSGSDEFRAWAKYFDDVASALEAKISELSAAHERERRFTADVAHDLRTPLGAMVSASSILGEYLDELPEGAKRPAELLINDVKRLRRLVNDILEIGRLDSNAEAPFVEVIDVEALLRGVLLSVGAKQDVAVEINGEPRIRSDRVRLERILSNLVANALKHGHGESVKVTTTTTNDVFLVDVSDNGPGIPEEELPHIFDRFHKASKARTGDGSGLGLAIACQHATVLGGSLTAANNETGGAIFHLEVPLADAPAEDDVTI